MSDLPERARAALSRAQQKRMSYAVRLVRAPDGRTVAILGEAHMKLAEAADIGRGVVEAFDLRGVESFQARAVLLGRTLAVLIVAPRLLLRVLTLGALKGSTITEARRLRSGRTVLLEQTKQVPIGLHVASLYMSVFFLSVWLGLFTTLLVPEVASLAPTAVAALWTALWAMELHLLLLVPAMLLRRRSWSWVIHPFIGILTPRDELMAAGTVQMLAEHQGEECAVVVMGRAHVPGVTRLLVEKYGFASEG